jgi:hypothetical protein
MSRPMNKSRADSLKAGAVHYTGSPCQLGHAGTRYTSTGACVDCVRGQVRSDRLPAAARQPRATFAEMDLIG